MVFNFFFKMLAQGRVGNDAAADQSQLRAGFEEWEKVHPGEKAIFPDIRYVLLHSLSHLLITAARALTYQETGVSS